MLFFKSRRRRRIRQSAFPAAWEEIIVRNVPLYRRLPEPDRVELRGHILVFLAEKAFEGVKGFVITDEVRVTIAAQACLLLLHRETDYFPGLSSVVVYPTEYLAKRVEQDEAGVVHHGREPRMGEWWGHGTLVLAWDDVMTAREDLRDGYNVVIHEFAHELDWENGEEDGTPLLPGRTVVERWREVFTREMGLLVAETDLGGQTFLDPYGAEHPAEFFAVVTEAFFDQPRELRERHPDLYRELQEYFRQDPAAWPDGAF